MNQDKENLVWVDIEGTGLEIHTTSILEVALIITDKDLNPLNQGLDIVIHQPDAILENMNDWAKEHHQQSGLTNHVRESKIDQNQARDILVNEIKRYTFPNSSPLCGNSVYYDKSLLEHYMPEVLDLLHYRIIDVSSLKELYARWYPQLPKFVKKNTHRALDDILESIEEIKFYRRTILK